MVCTYTPPVTVCVKVLQVIQFGALRLINETGREAPCNVKISEMTRV